MPASACQYKGKLSVYHKLAVVSIFKLSDISEKLIFTIVIVRRLKGLLKLQLLLNSRK